MIINHGLIEHPSFAPNNVKELIELAKQKPGEINYGTYGIGSSGHLNMVLLETMAGREAAGRALQGRGAGDQRRARRAHPDGLRQRRLGRAADGRAAWSR